jgi:3D (Asp-Asp-Asp) domain-containing protein
MGTPFMKKGRHGILYLILIIALTFFFHACATTPKTKGKKSEVRRMLVTAYSSDQKSTGWKHKWGCFLLPPVYAYGPSEGKPKKVGITSDGSKAKKGTIAADITKYPYGTKMHIPGYGWGEVHDIGSAIKGEHIDIFFPDVKDAKAWGKKNLDVTVVPP